MRLPSMRSGVGSTFICIIAAMGWDPLAEKCGSQGSYFWVGWEGWVGALCCFCNATASLLPADDEDEFTDEKSLGSSQRDFAMTIEASLLQCVADSLGICTTL